MARQTIELGVIPDGAGGDTDRQAHDKSNSNATELYLFLGDGTNLVAETARQNIGALGEDDVYSMPEIDNFLSKKADLVSGLVPSSQLPSYVDDVLEFDDFASLPTTGEQGKIYVTIDNNKIYRWSGTTYIEIVGGAGGVADSALKLQTARNINSVPFDGTQDITIPKANIGLGNVDNTSDLNKPISTATQTALDAKADLDPVKRGIGNTYDSSLSYNINDRVLLNDGTEVISTIASNTNDPNVDMTGWVNNDITTVNTVAELANLNAWEGRTVYVKYRSASVNYGGGIFVCIKTTKSPDNGKVFNSLLSDYKWVRQCEDGFYDVTWYGAVQDSSTDNTAIIQSILDSIRPDASSSISGFGTGTVYFPTANKGFYYKATELHVPCFTTICGDPTGTALYGTTIYLKSDLPDSATNLNYNYNFVFKDMFTKKCHLNLYSKTSTLQSAGFMIVKLTNVYFDGTNESDAGAEGGNAISVKNVTFDVHLDKVYVNGYLGWAFGIVADNTSSGGISYLATGVFCTLNQCKFMNSGYGIYLNGAAADSTDVHCNNVLLDHNDIGLYADGTRASGMGELHIYFDSGRIELNSEHGIYLTGPANMQYKGWMLTPGNTPTSGNKIFLSPLSNLSFDGRFNGYVYGGGAMKTSEGSVITGMAKDKATTVMAVRNSQRILENSGEYVPLYSVTQTFRLTLNASAGFTIQAMGSGVVAGRWYGGMSYGDSTNTTASTPITSTALTATVGTSGTKDYLLATYNPTDKYLLLSKGLVTTSFVGFETIKLNSTNVDLILCLNLSNTLTPMISFSGLNGVNVDLLTLTGSIIFTYTTYVS